MSSSEKTDSGTSGSSSSSPSSPSSQQTHTHQGSPIEVTPNQETETPERKNQRIKTSRTEFRPVKSVDTSSEEESSDEDTGAPERENKRIKTGEGEFKPVLSLDTSSDEETETRERESKIINTGKGEFRPVLSLDTSSEEESPDEETGAPEREIKMIKTVEGEFRPVVSLDTSLDEETETPEQESKMIETGEAILRPERSLETSSEDESSDEEEESSEEEYDPDEKLILFSDTSDGNEEYDDITFLKYVKAYEQLPNTLPLPISLNEREPTRYDMSDLLLFVKRASGTRYTNFSRCRFRNKIIKMQSKYKNIVQEKGENPTFRDFNTPLGKLHFNLMKEIF